MAPDGAESFADRVETMRCIERGEREYCEGSPALQATTYYLDYLLAEAVAKARAASALPRRKVDVLISLCGFAAIPTVLTYELLRPRRLVVITSRDASDSVDLIGARLVAPDRLRFQDFRHVPVDASDPLDMYEHIARELDGRNGKHAVIDITGGRKVMSAAAALAAWQLNLGLTYIENQFDPVTRQLRHGEVRMIALDNPTTLFGEQELARALEMFRSGAFEAALDVRLLVRGRNHIAAHRADAAALAELGVTVYADSDTHAKGVIADGQYGALFSANFDADHGMFDGVEVGVRLDRRPALTEAHRYFEHAMTHADLEFVPRPTHRALDRGLGARWRRRWPPDQRLSVVTNDADWRALAAAATVGPVLWEERDGFRLYVAEVMATLTVRSEGHYGLTVEQSTMSSAARLQSWFDRRPSPDDQAARRGCCPAVLIRG